MLPACVSDHLHSKKSLNLLIRGPNVDDAEREGVVGTFIIDEDNELSVVANAPESLSRPMQPPGAQYLEMAERGSRFNQYLLLIHAFLGCQLKMARNNAPRNAR